MKRPIALLLSTIMLAGLTLTTGCAPTASGTEGAKLLLARDRLHAEPLREKMAFLRNDATAVAVSDKSDEKKTVPLSKILATADGGLSYDDEGFAKDGDTYVWTQFPNSADPQTSIYYYQSHFGNMEHFAERTAEMIDRIKTGVNQTDVWIEIGENEYMLTVDAGTETLFNRSDAELSICKRYVNDEGDVVYERYVTSEHTRTGFLLIPEKRYEYYNDGLFISAENERGYWNMMYGSFLDYEGEESDELSMQTLSMFDDVVVRDWYSVDKDGVTTSTENGSFTTADLKRDILSLSPSGASLELCALNGVSSVTAPHDVIQEIEGANGDPNRHVVHRHQATLHTQSGVALAPETTYLDGQVQVNGTKVDYLPNSGNDWEECYTGELSISMTDDTLTFEETLDVTVQFLNEVGLSLKDDTAAILSGKQKLDGMQTYYSWRDITMNSIAAVRNYQALIGEEFDGYDASYDAVKDAETIQEGLFPAGGVRGDFAPISLTGFATYADGTVSAENLALSVNAHSLLEKDTEYTVFLAIAQQTENGWAAETAMPLVEQSASTPTRYASGALNLSWTGTGKLPMGVLNGAYKVVAYAATTDGIRISEFKEVPFNGATGNAYKLPFSFVSFTLAESSLAVVYTENYDKAISLSGKAEYAFKEVQELLLIEAAKHGTPTGGVELYDVESNVGTPADENAIITQSAVYRVTYEKTVNGETVTGHVYCTVSVTPNPNDNELPPVPITGEE